MATGFGQRIHKVPVMKITQTSDSEDTYTEKIDMLECLDLEFLLTIGVLDSSAASGTWDLSVVSSSTVTAAGSAIAFNYQLSTAVGGDDMGDITANDSVTALSLTSDYNDLVLSVYVDPQVVAASGDDRRYVGLRIDGASDDNCTGYYSAIALFHPRHAQTTMKSSTA